MIISKEKMEAGIEIDLTGPNGNAFYLLGMTKALCKQLDKNFDDISTRMASGDYENLIQIFEKEFGDIVTLYR